MQQISIHLFLISTRKPLIMIISACLTKESYISKKCSHKADNEKKETVWKKQMKVGGQGAQPVKCMTGPSHCLRGG